MTDSQKNYKVKVKVKFACAGVSVVCNAVFRLTISCCVPEIFAIKSRSCAESRRNYDVLGPPNIGKKGPPKFLTECYKPGYPSNTWQSLVTIGQAISETRRRKKKDLNDSDETESSAASIAGGRP